MPGELKFDFNVKLDGSVMRKLSATKNFILMARFQKTFDEFSERVRLLAVSYAPEDTGRLRRAIKKRVIQNDPTKGLYNIEIYIDTNEAPYGVFQERGRRPGPAPYAKLRDWIERKFGLSGVQAHWATKGVLWKLLRTGFNKNLAPYQFLAKAEKDFFSGGFNKLYDDLKLHIDDYFKN